MDSFSDNRLTHAELAWELVEIFDELGVDQLNEMVAKNVPFETLEFFSSYAAAFGKDQFEGSDTRRLPNLMLLGYLLRVLEERLLEPDHYDA